MMEYCVCNCACGGQGQLQENENGFFVRCEFAPSWYTPAVYHTERKAISVWNQMQQEMDKLARDAMVAVHRGMSYGKYIPTKGRIPQDATPIKIPAYPGQSKREYCAICGGPMPQKDNLRRKYCGRACADVAANRQRDEYQRRQKTKKDK